MAQVLTNDQNYTDIANAIREKTGETTQFLPSEMAAAITNITTGGNKVAMGTFSPSGATTYNITFDTPLDAVPKYIMFFESTPSTTSNRTRFGFGAASGNVVLAQNSQYTQFALYGQTTRNSTIIGYSSSYPITTTSGTTGCPIKKATTTGFTACAYSTTYTLKSTYTYIAICE